MRDPGADHGLERQDGLDFVIASARDALNQEFARAERLDAKARSQMTMAAAWFGAVQAVAGIVLKDEMTETLWLSAIALVLVAAATALSCCYFKLNRVWQLAPQPAVSHETLEDMANAAGQPRFREQAVLLYRNLLGHAQNENDRRGDALEAAERWLVRAQVLALIELLLAISATVLTRG